MDPGIHSAYQLTYQSEHSYPVKMASVSMEHHQYSLPLQYFGEGDCQSKDTNKGREREVSHQKVLAKV